jgi:multimeric flavodoxin WrbA
MKIVAINSSHRGDKGYTHFLIEKLFDGAKNADAECETIVLAQHKINTCMACGVCHKSSHYLKCIYDEKDDVKEIFEKMRQADILIFATPIYIFNMTGLMKFFLDRITSTADSAIKTVSENGLFFHHIDKQLFSKPFVLLTTQDNFEIETSANVISYFKTFSHFLDAKLVGIITRKSGGLVGHGKDPEKEKQYPKIEQVYKAIEKAGFELAKNGKISNKTQKIANQNIINMPKIIEFLLHFKFIRRSKKFMTKILENTN